MSRQKERLIRLREDHAKGLEKIKLEEQLMKLEEPAGICHDLFTQFMSKDYGLTFNEDRIADVVKVFPPSENHEMTFAGRDSFMTASPYTISCDAWNKTNVEYISQLGDMKLKISVAIFDRDQLHPKPLKTGVKKREPVGRTYQWTDEKKMVMIPKAKVDNVVYYGAYYRGYLAAGSDASKAKEWLNFILSL